MKKLSRILVLFPMLFLLTSCPSSNGNGGGSSDSPVTLTPIQKLSSDENICYRILLSFTTDSKIGVYNPSEFRALVLGDPLEFESSGKQLISLRARVQGTNQLGGTIFKNYFFIATTSYAISSYTEGNAPSQSANISVGKVNAALNYYWTELNV